MKSTTLKLALLILSLSGYLAAGAWAENHDSGSLTIDSMQDQQTAVVLKAQ